MKLKECLIFLLVINLNPLGLWLNASTFEKFFEQKSCNIQQDEEHLPKASCGNQVEKVDQSIIR